jgi:oxaloacetate decarboxylase (Na+ extruding) subunit alpha
VSSAAEKRVGFVDSSLCTARLALWNGSASAEMLLPYLERMDDAGFAAVDILDPESTALAVQQGESPWRLLRYAAPRLQKTPANVWISARCLLGTGPLAPDLLSFGIATLAKCGVRRVTCFDAVNDVSAIESIVQICRGNELDVAAALVHVDRPRHDDRYYAQRARSLSRCPIRSIAVVDLAGSLGPIATRTLISAVRDAAPSTPIEFKSHCRSGVAEQCCFEAVFSGASVLHTCTETLAGGWSLPATGYFVEHFSRHRIALGVDPSILAEMNEYVLAVAQAHDLPLGRHMLPDASAERFQMPVALLRQSAAAAEKIGVSKENLLEECVIVQKDLGYPTLAHPIGAMVIAQAILHLANAKRFASIAPGVVAYVRGDHGVPPGPLNAELRACVAQMPELPRSMQATSSRKQDSNVGDDEQRLLSAWFPNHDLTRLNQAPLHPVRARTPEQYLKEQIERYPALQSIRVRKGDFFFELNRNTE